MSYLMIQAQEHLTGLIEDSRIVRYLHENPTATEKTNKNIAVKMPFIDDFSSYYGYPNQQLWADNFVFISDGFSLNNITIGSATFDAFDQQGQIYSTASTFPSVADFLTSRNIRLDSIFTGTPRKATPADSIYLSFFYQPQGIGDKPEPEDSLVVQFYNPVTQQWETIWSTPGMSFQEFINLYGVDFKSVMLPITNLAYFSPEFRFRFYNIVSLANNNFPTWAGNVDHWNIDYVYLNSGRNLNDTFPVDLAFRGRIHTLLENYISMPWPHFRVNPSANMLKIFSLPYKNYSTDIVNMTEQIIIDDISGTTPGYTSPLSASNLNPLTDTLFYRNNLPYIYDSDVPKNASFLVNFIINTATIPDMVSTNDTASFVQRFYNYFSYDDSTPEAGYALVGNNAQLAYKFTLSLPDTLKAIQMQFNRVYNDVNEDLFFNLRVWNEINQKPGNIIYEQTGLRPVVDGMYGFHNYILDEDVIVSGNIYVGWKQFDEDALNIGFDRNTNKNAKIFYNVAGEWIPTMYEGALMIRIIVGSDTVPFYTNEYITDIHTWDIVPNPVISGEGFDIKGLSDNKNYTLRIYSAEGRLLQEFYYSGEKIHQTLPAGIYILTITDNTAGWMGSKKLIICP